MLALSVLAAFLGAGSPCEPESPALSPEVAPPPSGSCAYTSRQREAGRRAAIPRSPAPRSGEQGPGILACPVGCNVAWVTRAPVPPRSLADFGLEGAEAAVIGSRIFVGHGNSLAADERSLRIYDIPTDTWTFGPDSFLARSEGVGAAVGGKLYAFGGRNTPACEEFDPATNLWTFRAAMPTRRKGMAVGVIADKIHVVGGSAGSGPHNGLPISVHEVYDPVADTWSTAAPLPVALTDIYSSVAIGSRLYVFGGWDGGAAVSTTRIYDATTDTWSLGAPMPTARSNAVAGVLCSQVFVIGGLPTGLGANLTTVEVYDPVADTWCTGPAKPTGVAEGSTSGISTPTGIHVIGSGHSGNSQPEHEVLELQTSCLVSGLGAIAGLKGIQSGAGAEFSWQADLAAASYHLNTVRVKRDINDPSARLPPTGIATGQCDVAGTSCLDADAIADGTLLYYQVFSACGPTGADEGPFF